MWGVLGAGAIFVLALVMSLAKASSRGERLAEQHREELVNRKEGKQQLFEEKSMEHNADDSKKTSGFR